MFYKFSSIVKPKKRESSVTHSKDFWEEKKAPKWSDFKRKIP